MLVIDVNACFGRSPDINEDLLLSNLMRSFDSPRVDLGIAYFLRGVIVQGRGRKPRAGAGC